MTKQTTIVVIGALRVKVREAVNVSKTTWRVANRVDPVQTPHSAASDLGLHCLLGPICRNKGKYSIIFEQLRPY